MSAKWKRRLVGAGFLTLGALLPGFGPLLGDEWARWERRSGGQR